MASRRGSRGTARGARSRGLGGLALGLVLVVFGVRRIAGDVRADAPHANAPRAGPAGRTAPRGRGVSFELEPLACDDRVALGAALGGRGRLRVGTWNLRWFPDGRPGDPTAGRGPRATNVAALACEIAGLGVSALAVQEIKRTPRGEAALRGLTGRLGELTGGSWRAELDGCAGKGRQHVGLLYDASRLEITHRRDVAALNPHGDACAGMMRPGLAVYVRAPGGVDFHLVVVHAKSGVQRQDLDARARIIASIPAAHGEATALVADADVVIAGDFNTMGCPRCRPRVSHAEEVGRMDRALAALPAPLRRVPADEDCSEYYRGDGALLDHFLVSAGMAEVGSGVVADVAGLCGERACSSWPAGSEPPPAYLELSDHCPVVLEIEDTDRDG